MKRPADPLEQTIQTNTATADGAEKDKASQPNQTPTATTLDNAPLKERSWNSRTSLAKRRTGEASTSRRDDKDSGTRDETGNAMAATASAPQPIGNSRMPRSAAAARFKGKYPATANEANGVVETAAATSTRVRLSLQSTIDQE